MSQQPDANGRMPLLHSDFHFDCRPMCVASIIKT